ncbi:hypothetical protein [Rahnella contaminans]|uniref:hypothetical protein n=1 Tax=Rahnella contaminans TaxID=2703882 RepID=UPI003C30890F
MPSGNCNVRRKLSELSNKLNLEQPQRLTTVQAADKSTVPGKVTLLACAIVQIAQGDYSLATQANYVPSI